MFNGLINNKTLCTSMISSKYSFYFSLFKQPRLGTIGDFLFRCFMASGMEIMEKKMMAE